MFGTFRIDDCWLVCFFLLDSFKQMTFQNQCSALHVIIDTKSSFL